MSHSEHADVWIQKDYSPENSHCYGCGVANPHGYGLKTYLTGTETVSRFTPDAMYSGGVPGNVYGGMIASLFDCHGTASAAAFHRQHSDDPSGPLGRFVTASLHVNFLAPTPQAQELTVSGVLKAIDGRKVWVDMTLRAGETICATAEMLAIALRR
ncbi:PaaI family thioesterase [Cupriavidus taiwanensis]|uniref:PaaI family thioesterase n=1 Tax=Cupriavidus taiwanensis TaxID=164546 RepID=UPI0039C2D5B0